MSAVCAMTLAVLLPAIAQPPIQDGATSPRARFEALEKEAARACETWVAGVRKEMETATAEGREAPLERAPALLANLEEQSPLPALRGRAAYARVTTTLESSFVGTPEFESARKELALRRGAVASRAG